MSQSAYLHIYAKLGGVGTRAAYIRPGIVACSSICCSFVRPLIYYFLLCAMKDGQTCVC